MHALWSVQSHCGDLNWFRSLIYLRNALTVMTLPRRQSNTTRFAIVIKIYYASLYLLCVATFLIDVTWSLVKMTLINAIKRVEAIVDSPGTRSRRLCLCYDGCVRLHGYRLLTSLRWVLYGCAASHRLDISNGKASILNAHGLDLLQKAHLRHSQIWGRYVSMS